MAAPIQTVNCEQKTPNETPDQPISSGSTGLKNGTGMEEVNSEEVPGNMLINNKVKSPNQGREVTMENFQDGGPQHQLNMSAEQSSGYSSMDGPRINSEMNNYSQNTGDQGLANEEYGKMNDTMNSGQMQGYGGGYNNRGNYIGEQHGGSQMPGNADMQPNSQQNNPYNQYNQQTVRPGYPQTSKSMSMGPPRPPSSGSSMNVMPGYNASPGPQRFLPGHSISQQGGPTPTLNQLLQSPNAVHRYQNSYSEYNMGQPLQKVPGELSSSQQYPGPQSWGAPRGMNSYPPQLGSPGYRSQGVPLDPSQQTAMKRPPQSPYMGPGPNYPPHQQSPQGQYGPQYSQRYPGPQGPQSRPPSLTLGAQSFSQQQLGPQYSQQVPPSQQQMSGYEQRPPQGYIQQQASQNFQGTRSQQPANSTKEGSDLPTDGHDEDDGCFSQANAPKTFMNKKELSGSIDELPSEGNQALANSGTASSQVAHPAVSALRPTPSPSGSGSRSMSPAISNQQNIPMPPRPSSSQSDSGQNRMSQSPMAAQTGYNQPMAPPHMGPPIYGNKMHPGMIGGSQQMGPYSPQSQQFPQGAALSAGGQTLVAPLTGPTGEAVPIQDEASQQSTASNTSNTEERAETPRPRKDIPQSHPPTPASTLPSPGAASMSSFHDEFESVSSPSWPRTPASPVINSQVHEYHPPSKRPDGLNKLYDLSDDPERRAFLDRLVQFNEERGSAITQCPTISKQPLDLFRLYLVVKDRGGFVEVTKAKHWKDVAGQIGIGASSSAAYTLRKQYVRHLLPFECKFDRGGIDPQPIISQLEAASRKKTSSKTVTAPSPAGSSNSQDSFPASNSQSMDGFPTPPGPYSQYPQGSTPNSEYSNQLLGPPGTMQGEGAHPSMLPNHSNDSINVQNPFADDMQSHQYPRPGMNSNMPPPGLQNSYGYGGASGMQQRSQSMPSSTMPPPYNNSQAISGPAPGPGPGPGPTPGAYPYGDQMNRGTPIGSQQEYSGDQYRRSQMINHEGYTGRPSEPYVPPAGAYPPNRIQTTPAQYGYGPQFDRERFEQQQGGMMPPNQQMRPSSQPGIIQQHSGDTYPPHRYGTQPLAAREPAPSGYPPRSYSGPPPTPAGPAPQPTYVGPNDQYRQDQTYSMPSQTQTTDTSQAHLTSDSPKKSQQIYPPGQQGIYSPSNKMMPPQGYPQGPKRHPDFMKPGDQQYGSGPAYSQPGQPGQTTPQQPPYAGWRSDAQFGTYGSQGPATAAGQSPIGPQREDWPSRDQAGQWSPVHQRYPPQGPGHFNQGSNIPPHLPANLTPQNPMGPNASLRHLMMRVPPTFKDNKQSPYPMQPSKMQPPQMVNAQYPPKREIIFPPDSVEAVPPLLVKRKRMMSRDVTPVEAWRLMMALKSGLLCESTWALDVLSVLLFDDNTVLYFSLQHLPGLLEVLMEHYRRCLSEIFCISEELEIGFNGPKQPEVVTNGDRKWYEINGEIEKEDDEMDLGVIKDVDPKDRIAMVDCENYTFRSRHGKMVKVANKNDLFVSDLDKPWDIFEGFSSSSEHWQLGGGDTTIHIQTHFENDRSLVKLVRIMETVCNHKESDSDVKSECEKCSSEHDDKFPCNGKKEYCRTSSNKNSDVEMILDKPIKTEPSDSGGSAVEEGTDENKKTEETDLNSPLKVEVKEESSCNENETKPETVPTAKPSGPSYIPKIPTRKRPMEDYEDEAYNRDEPSLFLITDAQDSLLRRCLCISNILRSLSFVPGNDSEMSKHPGFLLVMGKLLLLHHNHALRRQSQRNYDKEEDADFSDSCSSLHDHEWWWEGLHFLRENTLVTLANIAGQLDLSLYPEEISLPILDGLLHWSVCPAAYAQDPLPTLPAHSVLSPQRLSLEALCKLSVQDNNVDLILATPPFSRIEKLFGFLARALSKHEDPVVREFSVVLLHYFAQAESGAARVIACQNPSVSLLIAFVEQAEQSALNIASTHGISMLRDNPDMMGTSLDMLRRAANTLLALSRVPENRPLFLQHQQRLLNLVMSQILDQHVAAILSDVLYECSQPEEVLS